jgi:predicted phosphodiesterase
MKVMLQNKKYTGQKQGILFLIFLAMLPFLQLSGQQLLSGPYLVMPGESEMTIRWEMDKTGNYTLEYGKSKARAKKFKLTLREKKHNAFLYEAGLTKLKPGETYYYRLMGHTGWKSFKTYRNNQDRFTFVAMGDSRSNPDIFKKILDETVLENPDFIISMGDLVEGGGKYDEWHRFYFSAAKDVVSSIPLVSTLGDHEADGDNGELFRYYLRKDEPTEKQWFSFDYGNTHFISLDYRHADDQKMIDWFINDITSSGKEWNIVYSHRGVYNFGGHRSAWGREIWPELFSKYKVDIVFAGHSHIYERFLPVSEEGKDNAVTYVTTGGAGAGLYDITLNKSVLAVAESVNHFVAVNINKNKLTFKAIQMDGTVMDSFEIIKTKRGYNSEYKNIIISQQALNTLAGFISAISQSLSAIPLYSIPVNYSFELQSFSTENIPFTIQIEPESSDCYAMKPYRDTLQGNSKKKIVLEITRKKQITISSWGEFDPALRLMMIYKQGDQQDTIIGGGINYWPETDY